MTVSGIKRKLAKLERKYKKIKVSNLDLQKKLEAMEKTLKYMLKKSLSGSSNKISQLQTDVDSIYNETFEDHIQNEGENDDT